MQQVDAGAQTHGYACDACKRLRRVVVYQEAFLYIKKPFWSAPDRTAGTKPGLRVRRSCTAAGMAHEAAAAVGVYGAIWFGSALRM
jgi:hypothetical protein